MVSQRTPNKEDRSKISQNLSTPASWPGGTSFEPKVVSLWDLNGCQVGESRDFCQKDPVWSPDIPPSWILVFGSNLKNCTVFLRGQPFQPWMKILDDFIHILVLGIGKDTSDDNLETSDILGILNEIAIPAKENIRSICWAMFLWPEIISLVNRVIVKYHFPL